MSCTISSGRRTFLEAISRESKKKGALFYLSHFLRLREEEILECLELIDKGEAYTEFSIKKKSGGKRKITAPVEKLKVVQKRILNELLYKIVIHTIAHGFTRDRDIITNAKEHFGARTVFNLDLKNAFPSVRTIRVMANLRGPINKIFRAQYSNRIRNIDILDILNLLAKLCTHNDCLPQGTPTSPALLNITCMNLDKEMIGLALDHGLIVTRYADDITFSSLEDEIPGIVKQKIRSNISNCGWKINQKKVNYLRRSVGNSIEVTGLLLQEDGRVTIPLRRRKQYRNFLHSLLEKEELTPEEKSQALGISVYLSRIYGKEIPNKVLNPWIKVKKKFGFKDRPAGNVRIRIDTYIQDIPDFDDSEHDDHKTGPTENPFPDHPRGMI